MPPQSKRARTGAPTDYAPGIANQSHNSSDEDHDPSVNAVPSSAFPVDSPLQDAPLDILFEIFALLHPKDLLTLTVTSKSLRTYLMNRRSVLVWRMARGLHAPDAPGCPAHLSEPQYAILLFTSCCLVCGQTDVGWTLWAFYRRYCRSCFKTCSDVVQREAIDYLLHEVLDVTGCDAGYLRDTTMFHQGHIRKQYFDRADAVSFKSLWKRCKTKQDKDNLVKERQDSVLQWRKEIASIIAWGHEDTKRQTARMDALRRERRDDIYNRLKAAGWGLELEELQWNVHCATAEVCCKAKVFTDDEWDDVLAHFVPCLEAIRTKRVKDERYKTILRRLQTMRSLLQNASPGPRDATSDLCAQFGDLAIVPSFRELLCAPVSTDVSDAVISPLLAELPALQSAWYQERQREFETLALTKESCPKVENPLSLAIVSFYCVDCRRENLRWPDVLAHRCGRNGSFDCPQDDEAFRNALWSVCCKSTMPWRRHAPFVATIAPSAVQEKIRLCGFDPKRVTYEELQKCGKRLYCTICSVPSIGYMEVFDWKNAGTHLRPICDVSQPFGPSWRVKEKKWRVLDDENSALVVAADVARQQAGDVPRPIFGCTRCYYRSRGFPEEHCKKVHGIRRPKIGQDFYLHCESGAETYPITVYPMDARRDRVAAKDVKDGCAVFSPSLFCA